MKIVLVSPFPLEQGNISGGVAAVSQCLSDALLRKGHQVWVIAPGKRFGQQERRGALTIFWMGSTRLPGFLTYANIQRFRIHKLLRAINPDVVHFQGSFGWSINCPYPYVVTIHGIAEKDAGFEGSAFKKIIASQVVGHMERVGRRKARQVISISPYATHLLVEQLQGDVNHIDNPIDPMFFDHVHTQKQPSNTILCVGVVGERKNTKGVIRAFAKLRAHSPDLTLTVCGQATNQTYLKECKTLVSELGLDSAVEFTGNLDRASLHSLLVNARALLMLSRQETAPMAIAEAMALGVPCIAPAKFGIPYMIENGKNGWLLEEPDANVDWQMIAQSLEGARWSELSANAEKSAHRYHPDFVADATEQIYQKACVLN